MKTYEINVLVEEEEAVKSHFITTDASKLEVQGAINFVRQGTEHNIEKLLIALRVLGFKARELKVTAEESFDL